MTKPYYDHGGIQIYLGDCHEILPSVEADVVVTDPPYGHGSTPRRGGKRAGTIDGEHVDLPWDVLDLSWLSMWGRAAAVFCASRYVDAVSTALRPDGMLIYVKSNPSPIGSSFEPCLTRGFPGHARHFTAYNAANGQVHPTQKPLDLMCWVVSRAPPGTIIDPFMGSGTTLRAAKDLGRKAVGIEIDECYCEIAAKRLAQETLFGPASR